MNAGLVLVGCVNRCWYVLEFRFCSFSAPLGDQSAQSEEIETSNY